MALKKCRECGEKVSSKAKICPNCGIKKPGKSRLVTIIALIFAIVFIYGIFSEDENNYDYRADKFSTLNLNVRSGPSTDYDVVTDLKSGESVKVIKDSLGWNLIETLERNENERGWASAKYLSNITEKADWEEAKKQEPVVQKEPTREERIEAGFSFWDGSHRELEDEVKDLMNDPSSYEHVETRYSDYDDYLLVKMRFRGSNAFGATVTQIATARCTIDGEVIEIVSIKSN